jgi:hypothetical protein
MTNPFHKVRRYSPGTVLERPVNAHTVESDFCYGKCRFIVSCSCGATHETRYIDEALEWSSMHRELAPLADTMAGALSSHG